MNDGLNDLLGSNAASVITQVPMRTDGDHVTIETSKVMSRYSDAYTVARSIGGLARAVKLIGGVLGAVTILIGLGRADHGPLMLAAIVLGFVVFLSFFIWGVLISAGGQLLKASVDGAVNNSPFMSLQQKARVMSLD
jgi:hypothetical protein